MSIHIFYDNFFKRKKTFKTYNNRPNLVHKIEISSNSIQFKFYNFFPFLVHNECLLSFRIHPTCNIKGLKYFILLN